MQDAYSVYINVGSSPIGNIISWRFLRENWKELSEAYVLMLSKTMLSLLAMTITHTHTHTYGTIHKGKFPKF